MVTFMSAHSCRSALGNLLSMARLMASSGTFAQPARARIKATQRVAVRIESSLVKGDGIAPSLVGDNKNDLRIADIAMAN